MKLEEKIAASIKFIQDYAKEAESFGMTLKVAFSGGKDSQVLYDLVKKANVPYRAVYSVTTNDPPENVRFIREHYPDVEFLHPKETFLQMIEKKGLPLITQRYCCRQLKEIKTTDFTAVGVRAEESYKRAKYSPAVFRTNKFPEYNRAKMTKKRSVVIYPILDWLEWEIWQYIEDNNIPINPCYDNAARVGCLFCPFGTAKQVMRYKEMYPKYYKLIIRSIDRYMKNGGYRKHQQFTNDPEEIFNWWASKKSWKVYFTQKDLFSEEK